MFSRASTPKDQHASSTADVTTVKAVPSIVSSDLTIEGNLSSAGEIQVDGVVHGDIKCKALIVGVRGSVTGEVTAQTVRMHGAVKGMIRAKSVFLASTARMSGDVEHESLAIEPGAYMEGHCKRITETVVTPAAVTEVPRRTESLASARVGGGLPKPAMVGA